MRLRTRLTPRCDALESRTAPATFTIADGDIAGLAAAITASNTNAQPDIIQLAPGGTYTFTAVADAADGGNALPSVLRDGADANALLIEGNGATFQRSTAASTPQFRFLRLGVFPNNVFVTVANVRFVNGDAGAADGGAVLQNAGDLSIQGCTFEGNRGTTGGAVYVQTTSTAPRLLAIADSTFAMNATTGTGGDGAGGAVYSLGSSALDVQRSQFIGNTSTREGGAIRVQTSSASVNVAGSTFAGNTANGGSGGGALFVQGPTTIANTVVRDNVSAVGGGGIWVQSGGSLTIAGSTVSGNRANGPISSGGGIFSQSSLTVVNSTIHDNRAANGGGLAFSGGAAANATVTHSTVTDNRAFSGLPTGGGIRITGTGVFSLGHTVVAGNTFDPGVSGTGPDVSGAVNSLGYNLIQTTAGTTITGTTAGNVTGVAAGLGPLQDNGGPTFTRLPLAGSPVLNAGSPAFAPPPAADQRGEPRVADGRIDIGAAEAIPPRVADVTVNAGQANATQRSRVTSIAVTFDAVVTFAGPVADAFALSRIDGGAVGGFTATANEVGGVTVVTLTGFTGNETQFGSLADGRFAVLVRASQVSAHGLQLDGDGNLLSGDDYALNGTVANGLFRLFGDVTGDGVVNASDFGQFRPAFGSSTGQSAYRDFLDIDGDGFINAFDFAQFRSRFGANVP